MVPSGMAPQLTAKYFFDLRVLLSCIILGITSFPEPLSPVISTVRSVGATCMATSIALLSSGAFPIIRKRCFILCNSSKFIPNPE
jgi:hypothetical protein